MRYVEAMLAADLEELFFVLWYLKQRGWVASDDKSNLLITVQGMDYLEANRPSPALVLPHIKASAIAQNATLVTAQLVVPDTPLPRHELKGKDIKENKLQFA